MKIIREILNVLIGLAVMISLLVGLPSVALSLSSHPQDIQGATILSFVLVAPLVFGYFLNKPKDKSVLQEFYKAKWLAALSTFIVTAIGLAVIYTTNLLIGLSISFGGVVIVLKFIVGPLWRCPVCRAKLPYLSNGKPGFAIKECPSCEVVLSKP